MAVDPRSNRTRHHANFCFHPRKGSPGFKVHVGPTQARVQGFTPFRRVNPEPRGASESLPCSQCGRSTPIDRLRRSIRGTLYCQSCLEKWGQ
jgi:hypothetical protein